MSTYVCLLISLAPTPARSLTVTRVFQDGVELNWLPPTEPNGEVHYVIEYKREDSGDWTSVSTTSDSTHYNLTGLDSGTNYTVRVVAVNSVGRAPIATISGSNSATVNIAGIVAGVAAVFLLILTLLTAGVVLLVVLRRAKQTTQGRRGNTAEKNAKYQLNKDTAATTKEQDGTAVHTYDYVNDEGSIEGRGALYQGLDVKTQDYVSAYSQLQLGVGAYQELDYQSREEEHHYHRANNGRKKHGERSD